MTIVIFLFVVSWEKGAWHPQIKMNLTCVLLGLTNSEIITFIRTDRRTWLYRLSLSPWSRTYILYGVCYASFCYIAFF